MDNNIAIEFENVGKQYRLGRVGTGTLSHDLNRWWQTAVLRKEDPYLRIGETNDRSKKGESDYVWALKDISFKVEKGDVVGIIGKNGAGKSTLLKLLSHITAPSTGDIRYRGRIASLLEVGTGFHPEMTARENIYMNGSIMGMTRQEITSKLDEIVDFAGIERYLDTPVKRFSSGMTVRLGFAVAAFLEPEILVVDEVLAVGDAEFQKKAIGKMKDVSQGEGRTVLFVSHNMAAVRNLCNKGILLENGTMKAQGTANDMCDLYLENTMSSVTNVWSGDLDEKKDFQLLRAEILSESGISKPIYSCDENVRLKLVFNVKRRIPGIYGYLQFSKSDGSIILISDSNDVEMNKLEQLPVGISCVDIIIPKRSLGHGRYTVYLNLTSSQNFTGFNVDSPGNICVFSLTDDQTNRGDTRGGYFSTLLNWNF
ncbi:MAG: polysaccharide ABC transporter ATP-binding protein [Bacteroidales bacterium]|nr:polysaccharide ABC transporter ATP-binding protein [Bacteroidales bacterium]